MKFGTKLLHNGNEIDPATGGVSIPIQNASTFKQSKADNFGKYEYGRSGNPTRDAIEDMITKLEGGAGGFAFSSGMAAISSVFLIFSPGDHFIVSQDVYGGTYRVLTGLFSRLGFEVTFTDFTAPEKIEAAIKGNTKCLYAETPSNPLLRITDLRAVAAIARKYNLLAITDNTFMTPYLQRPIELGFDIVIHSATKYLGGHSDLIAGLVVTADEATGERVKYIQNCLGAVLGPQDCWLLMRGMKTLKVRLDMHQAGAARVAEWLAARQEVKEVFFPGLPRHPGRKTHEGQADGPGGIVAFRMYDEKTAKSVLENMQIPVLAVSLGAAESIVSYPVTMSHAGMHPQHRELTGITGDLIRFSVGLEDPDDLIADLERAFHHSA